MGVYYLVVNPLKREYLDPRRFGSGTKFGNLFAGDPCSDALKRLIADDQEGWWVGDPVVLAADDSGVPNRGGLLTTTASEPARNLYSQARQEFTDISYRALAMLARNPRLSEDLARAAADNSHLLLDLGSVIDEYGVRPLEIALESVVGRPWRKAFNLAVSNSPLWRPVPRLEHDPRSERDDTR